MAGSAAPDGLSDEMRGLLVGGTWIHRYGATTAEMVGLCEHAEDSEDPWPMPPTLARLWRELAGGDPVGPLDLDGAWSAGFVQAVRDHLRWPGQPPWPDGWERPVWRPA